MFQHAGGLDGKLPDFDYASKRMQSLEEFSDDRVLVEYVLAKLDRGNDASFGLKVDARPLPTNNAIQEVFITAVDSCQRDSQSDTDSTTATKRSGTKQSRLRVGDQICRINGTDIDRLETVLRLLHDPTIKELQLLLIRPNPNNRSAATANSLIYTTSDRLIQTMRLQQQVLEAKLKQLNLHSSLSQVRTMGEDQNSHQLHSLHHPSSPHQTAQDSQAQPDGEWVVRRRSNGSRYITKRPLAQSHRLLESMPPQRHYKLQQQQQHHHQQDQQQQPRKQPSALTPKTNKRVQFSDFASYTDASTASENGIRMGRVHVALPFKRSQARGAGTEPLPSLARRKRVSNTLSVTTM